MRKPPGLGSRADARARLMPIWVVLFTCLMVPAHLAQAKAEIASPGTAEAQEVSLSDSGSASNVKSQDGSVRRTKSGKPTNKTIRLFGTLEFRGILKNMPKWQRVATKEQRSRTFEGDLSKIMQGSLRRQWLQLVKQVSDKSDMEKCKAVTEFFNRWPYKTDMAVYKLADYWATPAEFLKNSGDCEDYAITKFYALLELGLDPENMRIVALKDTIRNIAHAVLVVYMNDDVYLLDNLTNMVITHNRYKHYLPHYSVNEVYRWAHVRPRKK